MLYLPLNFISKSYHIYNTEKGEITHRIMEYFAVFDKFSFFISPIIKKILHGLFRKGFLCFD